MSSNPSPPDVASRGHIRRALRRITTTFRRADGQQREFEAEVPEDTSPTSTSHNEHNWESPMSNLATGPSQVHNAPLLPTTEPSDTPLVPATNSSDALLAADDTTDSYLSSLDPSMQAPEAFIRGEWTLDRATAHTDRSQRLLSRYGVEVPPYGNSSSSNLPTVVHRVQRAPRMRVHRACHECGVEFNQHKKCRACGHDICRRCPRSEGRRVRAVLDAERQSAQAVEGSRVAEAGPSEAGPPEIEQSLDSSFDAPSSTQQSRHPSVPSIERGLIPKGGMPPLPGPAPNAAWPENLEVDDDDDDNPYHVSELRSWKGKGKERVNSPVDIELSDDHLAKSAQVESMSVNNSIQRPWAGNVPIPQNIRENDVPTSNELCIGSNFLDADDPITARPGMIQNNPMSSQQSVAPSVDATNAINITAQASFPDSKALRKLLRPDDTDDDISPAPPVRNFRSRLSMQCMPFSATSKAQDLAPSMKTSDGQPKMFPAVQRVYRKPRQRVRYMCHHCDVPLLQAQTCNKCGHQRCEQCRRRPSLKHRPEPDPLYAQAFERRLSAMHQGLMGADEHARRVARNAVRV